MAAATERTTSADDTYLDLRQYEFASAGDIATLTIPADTFAVEFLFQSASGTPDGDTMKLQQDATVAAANPYWPLIHDVPKTTQYRTIRGKKLYAFATNNSDVLHVWYHKGLGS